MQRLAQEQKRDNANDKIIHLSELELKELIDNKTKKATLRLEEIKKLKSKLNEICASQKFHQRQT